MCCFKLCSSDGAHFDPLGINSDLPSALNSTWENLLCLFTQPFESSSSTEKGKPNNSQGVAGDIFLCIAFNLNYMSVLSLTNRGFFN